MITNTTRACCMIGINVPIVSLWKMVLHDKAQLSVLQQNPPFFGRENNYNLKFADSFPNIDPLPTEVDDRLYQLQQLSTKDPDASQKDRTTESLSHNKERLLNS